MTWSAAISESKPLWTASNASALYLSNVNSMALVLKNNWSRFTRCTRRTICSKDAVKAGPFGNVAAFCDRDTTSEAHHPRATLWN